MGPPPFGDGNSSSADAASVSLLVLQWGHRLSAMETRLRRTGTCVTASPFNGATAFRRWKLGPGEPPLPFAERRLQWGHRLSAMETDGRSWPSQYTLAPSMGPPPFGDGNMAMDEDMESEAIPSMGPPPFGDGNDAGSEC